MRLITRYILKYLFLSTILVTAVLTFAVWMTQSLRLLDALVNRGVTLSTFLKMMIFLVPDLVGIILPVSLVVGTLFTFSRFYADRELVVLRTLGLSSLRLSSAPLIMAGLVVIVLYALNFYLMPLAFQKFKDAEYALRNKVSAMVVVPGDFTTFKGLTVYVRDRRPSGALYGILIHDERGPKPRTLIAEKGSIKENATGIHLTLFEGTRQETDPKTGEPSVLSFEQYALEVGAATLAQATRDRKPYEHSLPELLKGLKDPVDLASERKLQIELHQRLLVPFTSLSFMLIVMGFFLGGDYDRRGRSKRIFASVVCCGGVELGTLGLLNLGQRSLLFIVLAYALVSGSALFGLFSLVKERWVRPQKQARLVYAGGRRPVQKGNNP